MINNLLNKYLHQNLYHIYIIMTKNKNISSYIMGGAVSNTNNKISNNFI